MAYYNDNWQDGALTVSAAQIDVRSVLQWVYVWMTLGLLVTAGVAVLTVSTPALLNLLYSPAIFVALVAELILVVALSAALPRLSPTAASAMFFVYSALNGFTLAAIALVYTRTSIGTAFFATAALFGAMSVVGFTTKADLTKLGTYLIIGLIGIVIAMIINIFVGSSVLSMIISAIGVVIFTGLTAYDTQKISRMAANPQVQADGSTALKLSVMGALILYLDFVNLFLMLLRLFGRRN